MKTEDSQTVILVAGHWLGSWAWAEVISHLTSGSVNAVAVTLPGFDMHDADRASRTLDDQAAAIVNVITQYEGSDKHPVTIVAHSGANAPVSLVLEHYPELVNHVIWVDSGPVASGTVFAPELPGEVTELPLPDFDTLAQQASLEGLSAEALEGFRAKAVPVPAPVLREPVSLSNDRRRQIPATFVCCSLSSAQIREMVQAGHPMFAEVAHLECIDYVDLPTGHWPMWSRPVDLARAIDAAVMKKG